MNAVNVDFEDDTPPMPPVCPGNDECCRGACDPCIFDVYEDALERYRADLRAWREHREHREKSP
ncbi:MAG TPA: oxidoreductase-like domain-containing protein [Casimicrobiaceae bacterium]|nr:oxidoreductase-like domain-containing protein [Casimicrobiaceae bacterium]